MPDAEYTFEFQERVCQRAYQLWEEAGCPMGRPEEFWQQAWADIEAAEDAKPRDTKA